MGRSDVLCDDDCGAGRGGVLTCVIAVIGDSVAGVASLASIMAIARMVVPRSRCFLATRAVAGGDLGGDGGGAPSMWRRGADIVALSLLVNATAYSKSTPTGPAGCDVAKDKVSPIPHAAPLPILPAEASSSFGAVVVGTSTPSAPPAAVSPTAYTLRFVASGMPSAAFAWDSL